MHSRQFIGAKFPGLDLQYQTIRATTNHPIDFRYSEFSGKVNFSNTRIDIPIIFNGCHFQEDVEIIESTVSEDLYFKSAVFEDGGLFTETKFEGAVHLEGSQFEKRGHFDGSRFLEAAFFQGAHFQEDYRGYKYEASFESTIFDGVARFRGITVDGFGDFEGAHFHNAVWFTDSEFDVANFSETVFEAKSLFTESQFAHGIWLYDASLVESYFDDIEIEGTADFRLVEADFLVFEPLRCSTESGRVHFNWASVSEGKLAIQVESEVVMDLQSAEIGDVLLTTNEEISVFERFIFDNTTFRGFEFDFYRDELSKTEWRIHTNHGKSDSRSVQKFLKTIKNNDAVQEKVENSRRLERTYMKAKNGADEVSDNESASAFFQKEMAYRQRKHGWAILNNELSPLRRFRESVSWSKLVILNIITGYGERSARVLLSAASTVGVFSLLFYIVSPNQKPYGDTVGYLILSLESFVTLVLGGSTEVNSIHLRLLAEIEGFLGAFFVALFVFTLTRSIHR